MNWDITIGECKQAVGRVLQSFGRRFDRRQAVLEGEQLEFSGRLQSRYGLLKHQAQWNAGLVRIRRQPAVSLEPVVHPLQKN